VGGFKIRALERAVGALRAHDIEVYLVEIPTSRWFTEAVSRSPGGIVYRQVLPRIAEANGAKFLNAWPDSFRDEDRFWDDTHMLASSTAAFTDALAEVLHDSPRTMRIATVASRAARAVGPCTDGPSARHTHPAAVEGASCM
jgi:hypothetical protein